MWENVYSSALYLFFSSLHLSAGISTSLQLAGGSAATGASASAAATASTAYTAGSTTPGTARPSRHDPPSIYGVRGVEVKEGLKREQGRG